VKSLFKMIIWKIIKKTPCIRAIYETRGIGCPVNVKYFFFQKILGFNRSVKWPVHFTSLVTGHEFISIGVNTAPGASLANYIFAGPDAPIFIGDYTVVASNVCIGSLNHDVHNISKYVTKGGIYIGSYCWIAANSVVLSGVTLGDHTVVAAGSVVNKSFPEGYCILAGNPAKIVKNISPDSVVRFEHPYKYCGYKRLSELCVE